MKLIPTDDLKQKIKYLFSKESKSRLSELSNDITLSIEFVNINYHMNHHNNTIELKISMKNKHNEILYEWDIIEISKGSIINVDGFTIDNCVDFINE